MVVFRDDLLILKLFHMKATPTSLIARDLGISRNILSYVFHVANMSVYSPICPQVSTDFHHLLRVPEEIKSLEPKVDQDEFECLNLAITVPARSRKGLPVMIWIHGGSLKLSPDIVS